MKLLFVSAFVCVVAVVLSVPVEKARYDEWESDDPIMQFEDVDFSEDDATINALPDDDEEFISFDDDLYGGNSFEDEDESDEENYDMKYTDVPEAGAYDIPLSDTSNSENIPTNPFSEDVTDRYVTQEYQGNYDDDLADVQYTPEEASDVTDVELFGAPDDTEFEGNHKDDEPREIVGEPDEMTGALDEPAPAAPEKVADAPAAPENDDYAPAVPENDAEDASEVAPADADADALEVAPNEAKVKDARKVNEDFYDQLIYDEPFSEMEVTTFEGRSDGVNDDDDQYENEGANEEFAPRNFDEDTMMDDEY